MLTAAVCISGGASLSIMGEGLVQGEVPGEMQIN